MEKIVFIGCAGFSYTAQLIEYYINEGYAIRLFVFSGNDSRSPQRIGHATNLAQKYTLPLQVVPAAALVEWESDDFVLYPALYMLHSSVLFAKAISEYRGGTVVVHIDKNHLQYFDSIEDFHIYLQNAFNELSFGKVSISLAINGEIYA